MSFEIPARQGIKVYFNEGGSITIQQVGSSLTEEPFVDLHPADARNFIKGLNKLLDEEEARGSRSAKPANPFPPATK